MSVEEARARAQRDKVKVADGKDPAQERAEERRRELATLRKLLATDGPYDVHLKQRKIVRPGSGRCARCSAD